jgi:S-adenosylmethionine hydrolase
VRSIKRKKCAFCGQSFTPDPRAGKRQKACPRKECRRQRKSLSQKRWVEKNPEYFHGRYANTRAWLDQHPGYLREYRRNHPEYVEKNRIRTSARKKELKEGQFDIQDELKSQLIDISQVKFRKAGFDIQDELSAQQACLAGIMLKLLSLIYKTS